MAPQWLNIKGPRARLLQGLLIVGLIGILLLSVHDIFGQSDRPPPGTAAITAEAVVPQADTLAAGAAPAPAPAPPGELAATEQWLARELEDTLAMVAGAGAVKATVRLASGPTEVFATDTRQSSRNVEETVNTGDTRVTRDGEQQSAPVLVRGPDADRPLTIRREAPRIASVVVVAAGAANDRVRERLTRTAAAALAVPLNRITVVPMGGNGK